MQLGKKQWQQFGIWNDGEWKMIGKGKLFKGELEWAVDFDLLGPYFFHAFNLLFC